MIRFIFLCLLLIGAAGGSYYYLTSEKSKSQEAPIRTVQSQEIPTDRMNEITPSAGESVTQKGKAWTKRCEKDSKYCEIFQRLEFTKTKQRLTEVAIGYPKDAKDAHFVAVLPLGLMLPEGLIIRAGDQQIQKADIATCMENGCVSMTSLTAEMLETLKLSKKMILTMKDSNGKVFNIEMPLDGFSESLGELAY